MQTRGCDIEVRKRQQRPGSLQKSAEGFGIQNRRRRMARQGASDSRLSNLQIVLLRILLIFWKNTSSSRIFVEFLFP